MTADTPPQHTPIDHGLTMSREAFVRFAARARERAHAAGKAVVAIPLGVRLLADQLTPVVAYRRLVAPDERTAPSFLLESVEGGARQGRFSILGSEPALQVYAFGSRIIVEMRAGSEPGELPAALDALTRGIDDVDPLTRIAAMTRRVLLAPPEVDDDAAELPPAFLGGWAGYAGYDSVRYAEPAKLPFDAAPPDDRGLPDVDFGFYPGAVVFDGVTKLVTAVRLALLPTEGNEDDAARAWKATTHALASVVERLQRRAEPMRTGVMPSATRPGERAFDDDVRSNTTPAAHRAMVERAKEYIRAGDIFQVVVGQRFERRSTADPFDVYRALRALNPSPYMGYVQGRGCILVASSPEILCRVRAESTPTASDQTPRFTVTNRPLAGTRRRGGTPDEDAALEAELLADQKERAEHVMLVDLGRNDVGRVCEPGSVRLEALMDIERYSHVMHISSTVTGTLRAGLDCWDALRATLPVGTISGAPKIRAMQIIDELETAKRGPYGGGFGVAGLDGSMDIALALRTIVTPTGVRSHPDDAWTYHLQAAGGIVFDSEPQAEYDETVNKASASAAAIKIAEAAFGARR